MYAVHTPFPPLPVGRRHLSYHIYPVRGNGVWQRRIRQLVRRWSLFDGLKVIAVATDGRTDIADAVRAMLPADAVVYAVPNDPEQGEGATWHLRWNRILAAADDTDAVLYAHAKGVTRPEKHFQEWGDICLTALCDHWPAVESQLRTRPAVGVLPIHHGTDWCGVKGCDWHYSGTHYWQRVGALRAADRTLGAKAGRWGVEAWPGGAFRRGQGGHVGIGPAEASSGDRNTAAGWAVVKAAWERWAAGNPAEYPAVVYSAG